MELIKCNKCSLHKVSAEFNKSDISQRRYICKICKKQRRAAWKGNRNFPEIITCINCDKAKDKSEFILSDLQNSTFYCRDCHNDLNINNINTKRQKEQP